MAVTDDTEAALAAIRAEIDQILNYRRIAATQAWEESWGRLQDALTAWADAWADLAEAQLRGGRNPYRNVNLRAMRQVAEDELRGALGNMTRLNNDALSRLARSAGLHAGELLESQIPHASRGAVAWQATDPRVLAGVVKRTTEQITVRHYHLAKDATKAMRSALRVGAAAGDNPRTVARAMIRNTETVFNGGLARAEVIARTELLDGYRNAARAAELENVDILAGWQWLAELSSRTCPSCLGMNGTTWPTEDPGPLDHHAGRCMRVPLLRPLKELGIRGPEPQSVVPDSEAWFKAQPPGVQREIMGPKRFEAWKEGRFPREAWARRVETEGWRPAYHVGNPAA